MPQPGLCPIVNNSVLIALGANATSTIGEPYFTVLEAIERLACDSLTIHEISAFYSTPAFPKGSGPDFVNAVLSAGTSLDAPEVLAWLHKIEHGLGRDRKARWAPRTIDLDLIAFADRIHPDVETYTEWHDLPLAEQQARAPDGLILPHPRLQDRAFVLGPLCEIAPDWCHPVLKQTAQELFEALPEADKTELKRLSNP